MAALMKVAMAVDVGSWPVHLTTVDAAHEAVVLGSRTVAVDHAAAHEQPGRGEHDAVISGGYVGKFGIVDDGLGARGLAEHHPGDAEPAHQPLHGPRRCLTVQRRPDPAGP